MKVQENEIWDRAKELFPVRYCWYGSNPSKLLDDNENVRLNWVAGYKAAIKDTGGTIDGTENYFNSLLNGYYNSFTDDNQEILSALKLSQVAEKYSAGWWHERSILRMYETTL